MKPVSLMLGPFNVVKPTSTLDTNYPLIIVSTEEPLKSSESTKPSNHGNRYALLEPDATAAVKSVQH